MDNFSERLSIDTPENVLLNAEVAGFGSRCLAALVDYTIMGVVFFCALTMISTLRLDGSSTVVILALYLFFFVLFFFYHLIFEILWNGQTPGKRVLGLRVIRADGLPASVTSLVIRNLVRIFDFFPVGYGVGMIVLFATKRTQRLGDLAARTLVIREKQQVTLKTIQEDMSVHYLHITRVEPLPSFIQIDQLTEADRNRIIDYLKRRTDLRDRETLSRMLARQTAEKMGDEARAQQFGYNIITNERFLEQVVRTFEVQAHMQQQDNA